MSKHTPGPWQVHCSHIYTADPERALLAQVFNPGSKASDYPLVENARLIAAAPELLALLKEVCEETLHPDYDWSVDLAQRVRAAIAKAEDK